MQDRVKIGLVIIMAMLLSGCTASRKRMSSDSGVMTGEADYAEMVESIKENNITDNGLIIKKGRIEIEGTEIKGSFGVNAKMNKKGDFYLSVRGPLGIELVRLLAVGNDIAAIDRFNKTVYIGKKDEVMKRIGMPGDFFKIIFGDIPEIDLLRLDPTYDGVVKLLGEEGDFEREISICVVDMKICREQLTDTGHADRQVILQFSDFRNTGDRKYASEIEMKESTGMFHVKLNIDELEIGFNSDIEFTIPSYLRRSL